MKATVFSKEPYYPMLLSNGQDGILIDYSGSNFCSNSSHTEHEQMLGAVTGWYKASTRKLTKGHINHVLRAGYQVILYGVPCEPDRYEQWLDAKEGVLYTDMVFQKELRISVEGFLTDDGLWGERLTVTACPEDWKAGLGFRIGAPAVGYGDLMLKLRAALSASEQEYGFGLSYEIGGAKGLGALLTEKKFDSTQIVSDNGGVHHCEGMYENIKTGLTVSRILFCLDTTETEALEADFDKRFQLAAKGYDAVKKQHIAQYAARTSCVSVSVPDEKLQQVYDMSRYVIQGSRNRQSGALLLGIQPYLWGGGLYCSYDAYFDIMALLSSGDKEVVAGVSKFFDDQANIGEEALKEAGLSGIAFTGWTDCYGNFARTEWTIAESLLNEKPVFICNEVMNRYAVWKFGSQKTDERLAYILRQVYVFFKKYLLQKKDGKYCLINVKAGNEAGFDVEADTFTIMALAKALFAMADMLDDHEIHAVGEEVLEALEQNYTQEGVLLPFKDAPYLAGMQFDYYIYMLPEGIPFISVERALERAKTPWGYDFGQSQEVFRHWPWICGRAAICYTHEGRHEQAMEQVKSLTIGATSLGALPEKIFMNGMPSRYWYTSAHALVVWAIHDALAHMHGNELRLCYGLTDQWQDFSCEGICMENGLVVSLTVKNGAVQTLKLRNESGKDVTVNIKCNNCFAAKLPETCTLAPRQECVF